MSQVHANHKIVLMNEGNGVGGVLETGFCKNVMMSEGDMIELDRYVLLL